MSLKDGLSAMNLEMPKRIPRFEIVIQHWELISKTTGLKVAADSSDEQKTKACKKFMDIWNLDLNLQGSINRNVFGEKFSNMGHGQFNSDREDFDDNIQTLYTEPEDIFSFDPYEVYGAIDKKAITEKLNDNYNMLCSDYPDRVNTDGIYVTLFTGLTYIFGWEMMLMAGGIDPVRFGEVANRYTGWIMQYYEALAESDIPYVYCHDDIVWTEGAVFHPEWYRKYVFPNYSKLYNPLLENKKKIIFICDGNYTEFVDDILKTGVHGFFFEPYTDLKYIAERCGQTHVIVGNADTRILLSGTKQQIKTEVERCIDIGKNCPGYFMCVSNMIPANTPVDNVMYYNDLYQKLGKR